MPSWKEKGSRIISKVGPNWTPQTPFTRGERTPYSEPPETNVRCSSRMCVPVPREMKWDTLKNDAVPLRSMKRMHMQHTHVWTCTRNTLTQTHTCSMMYLLQCVVYCFYASSIAAGPHHPSHTHTRMHVHTHTHTHTHCPQHLPSQYLTGNNPYPVGW